MGLFSHAISFFILRKQPSDLQGYVSCWCELEKGTLSERKSGPRRNDLFIWPQLGSSGLLERAPFFLVLDPRID